VPLNLRVDSGPWTDHLRSFAAARPGLVPVCKGNGYGFGLRRLAETATELLGVDLIAIGTEAELAVVAGLDCDVLVLTPDPGWPDPTGPLPQGSSEGRAGPSPERVIRTASTVGDVERLLAVGCRFVVECRTAIERHGVEPAEYGELARLLGGQPAKRTFAGWGLHLPLAGAGTWGGSARARIVALREAGLPVPAVFVSHLDSGEIAALAAALPGLGLPATAVRARIGTDLWLGRRDVLHPTATVLDVHPLPAGARAGYWQRRVRTAGAIVVVSGGTAHGIGLTAPPPPTARRRLASLRAATGDSIGRARSPFVFDGHSLAFHEPPHMQVSLLWLPGVAGSGLPSRGSELGLRVRYTTTVFDSVRIAD
jgi:hypothetical protein